MSFNLDDLKKVEASSIPIGKASAPKDVITAIIKVAKANYIPKNVQVRATISPTIFTCEFLGEVLASLEKDKNVRSISMKQALSSDAKKDTK